MTSESRLFCKICLLLLLLIYGVGGGEKSRAQGNIYSNYGSLNQNLNQKIEQLEKQLGVNAVETSTLGRVGSLEHIIFGRTQSGTLVERVNALCRAAAAKMVPPPTLTSSLAPSASVDPDVARLLALAPPADEGRPNFIRFPAPGNEASESGDYFEEIWRSSQHRIMRFQTMPVPVYITPYAEGSFVKVVVHAFETWEDRSNQTVRFVQVEDPARARIRVIWSHLGMSTNPNDTVLGAHTITRWRADNGTIFRTTVGGIPTSAGGAMHFTAEPQVIEVNLDLIHAKPRRVQLQVLHNVVAHELGHALGINGHSPVRSDLMNSVTDEFSRLSQRDINTLNKIYSLPADISL